MNRYYTELARYEREGFDVIVDKTWEEDPVSICFDDSCYDIRDMEEKVNSGFYDWFMLRVRVLVDGHELGSSYLGGCLYEDAREVLSDGTAEDQIFMALEEARTEAAQLHKNLTELLHD